MEKFGCLIDQLLSIKEKRKRGKKEDGLATLPLIGDNGHLGGLGEHCTVSRAFIWKMPV